MEKHETISRANRKSTLDAQRYRASFRKKDAKKMTNTSQDSGNDLDAMSCEPNSKRKRVANQDTEVSQQCICSSDGSMIALQQGSPPSKYVNHQELERSSRRNGLPITKVTEKKVVANEIPRSLQMEGSPASKKKVNVGTNEDGVDASRSLSPSVVQGSSKSPSAGLDNLRFREYLVPVQLTDIQLEQYCSTLITNSGLLCSSTKKGNLDPLLDVIGILKKCCDHPYVLDSNLQSIWVERYPLKDYLSIGIRASGKLQLLSKFLPKVREKGMRVLIVYKSQTPSSIVQNCLGIGHILDDFICQSFGQESYVHIYNNICVHPKQTQAAIDLFNDKTSGRFVVLTEYTQYRSIRLKYVDLVVLFNSDRNPVNDIRALQKMNLHTENDHLRFLRLYTSFTLEEKALCMARDGSGINSIRPFINTKVCQMLLTWGAAYRFEKLDELHSSSTPESPKSLEDEFFKSVLHELFSLLSSNTDDTSVNFSVISKVNEIGEYFAGNIKLYGELELQSLDGVPPHVIWASLLPGKTPHWRYLPSELDSAKRRVSLSGLRGTGVMHEELPGWYRDKSLIARRSKRVAGCTLGFQQRLQAIRRRMLENEDMDILENLNEPLDKLYQLKKDSVSEPESLSKCVENLFVTRTCEEEMRIRRIELLKNLPEDFDCEENDAIDSGNSIMWPILEFESAAKTLKDDKYVPIQELSSGERLNMVNGNELVQEVESIENLSSGERLNIVDGNNLLQDVEISTNNLRSGERLNMVDGNDLLQDFEISTRNLPKGLSREFSFTRCDAEDVRLKNDENQAFVGLVSSSMVVATSPSIQGSGQPTFNGFMSHDVFQIFHECLPIEESALPDLSPVEELDVLSDQVVLNKLNTPDSEPSLSECELEDSILEKDQNCDPQIAVPCSLSAAEKEGPIYGMQSSEELDVLSMFVNPDDQQMPQQHGIDQSCQVPAEQLPSTLLLFSEIRVTDESRPSTSCDYIGIGESSYNSRFHQPAGLNPLQAELGKIMIAVHEAMKKHEDMVVQLGAARDEQIKQINAKYALLFGSTQSEFLRKKEELNGRYEKTRAHMLLAEAWRLASDDSIFMYNPPSLDQSTTQMDALASSSHLGNLIPGKISTNQIFSPQYPPLHQNLYSSQAGWRFYAPNLDLCTFYPTPIVSSHGFFLPHSYQHPLNFTPPGSSGSYS